MDADEQRALLVSFVLMVVGVGLIALALWLFAQDLQDAFGPRVVPAPGSASTGAQTHHGAPAWAHTCDGGPREYGCPLP